MPLGLESLGLSARALCDLATSAPVVFDAALMAAMNWPWPVIVFDPTSIVASGSTPSATPT